MEKTLTKKQGFIRTIKEKAVAIAKSATETVDQAILNLAVKVKSSFSKEKVLAKQNGGKAVIVELLFVAISVVLILFFKEQIMSLVSKVSGYVTNAVDTLFK